MQVTKVGDVVKLGGMTPQGRILAQYYGDVEVLDMGYHEGKLSTKIKSKNNGSEFWLEMTDRDMTLGCVVQKAEEKRES